MCSAGLVGGQDAQPGSTRTPSPAVAVVAGELLVLRVVARIYQGGGFVAHGTIGPDRQIARNPRRPAVPRWGGDIPCAPGCSLGVTIRWLWGVKQPSRLTCSRKQAPRPAPAIQPLAGSGAAPSVGPCGCSRCADGATPRGVPAAPSCRGNQALAAGSETRRRSVDGTRLLKE